jgi:acyl carrier protein
MEKLIEILEQMYPDARITPETRLVDDGILTSLDIVELVSDVDDAFGVRIPAHKITPENFNTPSDIYALIEALQSKNEL